MPTLWEEAGFSFRFRVGDCGERPHVHVTGNGGTAKLWQFAEVGVCHLSYNVDMDEGTLTPYSFRIGYRP